MAGWFYESKGDRVGPVAQEDLQGLHASGEIHDNTLVWNKDVAADWRPYSLAGLATAAGDAPPPLPTTHVNNTYAWIFALVPLIGVFVENLLSNASPNFDANSTGFILAYIVAYAMLGGLDARQIERSGRNKKSVQLKWVFFIAPAYLFQRARALGHRQYLLAIWIVAFVAALAVKDPEILKGNLYLGAGLPKCDSGASLRQVKDIFDTIPLVRNAGVTALNVSVPMELSSGDKQRSCKAFVSISNGNTVGVTYDISERGDQYYYQVQIQQ